MVAVPRLYLIRHGEAAEGWTPDSDPDLSDLGHRQAAARAEAMAPLGPLPVRTSPLRRTRSTAAPLEALWGAPATVDPAIGEFPSPGVELAAGGAWLAGVLRGTWAEATFPETLVWRAGVIDAVLALDRDTVLVTHFVAINLVVGTAEGTERVTVFRPANASCTIVEHDGESLRVIERGSPVAADNR